MLDELATLEKARLSLAKDILNRALTEVFTNPEIKFVGWGEKFSEYDDEGMYPGISGPFFNVDYHSVKREDESWNTIHECLFGSGEETFLSEYSNLKKILEGIDTPLLCQIVGDDDYVVVAKRTNKGFIIQADHWQY